MIDKMMGCCDRVVWDCVPLGPGTCWVTTGAALSIVWVCWSAPRIAVVAPPARALLHPKVANISAGDGAMTCQESCTKCAIIARQLWTMTTKPPNRRAAALSVMDSLSSCQQPVVRLARIGFGQRCGYSDPCCDQTGARIVNSVGGHGLFTPGLPSHVCVYMPGHGELSDQRECRQRLVFVERHHVGKRTHTQAPTCPPRT